VHIKKKYIYGVIFTFDVILIILYDDYFCILYCSECIVILQWKRVMYDNIAALQLKIHTHYTLYTYYMYLYII